MIKLDSDAIASKIAQEYVNINIKADLRNSRWIHNMKPKGSMESMVIDSLKRNMELSAKRKAPLCQDTGTPVVFISLPENACIDGDVFSKTEKALAEITLKKGMRTSMRSSPFSSKPVHNAPDMHIVRSKSAKPSFVLMAKGGGSENLTKLTMLPLFADIKTITDTIIETVENAGSRGCPPYTLGIGLGGNSEQCIINAKMALTGKFSTNTSDYEKEISDRILKHKFGIGIHGLGFGPTVLDCRIRSAVTHIASFPMCIAFQCYLQRVSKKYI